MNEKKEKRTFVFELKKTFKELPALCNIFNILFDENRISCKFKLLNMPIDYLSLSFCYEKDPIFVMNRDLKNGITAEHLLMETEINHLINHDCIPYFSTDNYGSFLEISFNDDLQKNPIKEFSITAPRNLPCILSTDKIRIKYDIPAKTLINIANSILEEGHLFISITRNETHFKMKLDIYLCHLDRPSLEFFFDVLDDYSKSIYLTCSKLNFVSAFQSRVIINYNSPELYFDLYEPRMVQDKKTIRNQFKILDSISPEI